MPTLSIIPMLQLGRKKTSAVAPAPTRTSSFTPPSGPQRWEQLLDEHDHLVNEVEDSFSKWLQRHESTVQESRQWKEAHESVAKELVETQLELTNTQKQLRDLQSRCSRESETDKLRSLAKTATLLPMEAWDSTHARKNDDLETQMEQNAKKSVHNCTQQLQRVRELQSKMDSYQLLLRWQERQTEQWRSRCDRQLNQIDNLLAAVEQQKTELKEEQEQCDILMDAVYHLIRQGKGGDGNPKPIENKKEKKTVEHHSSPQSKIGSSVSYPGDFYCPLTQQVFVDPVIDYEGNTYEKNVIVEWLELHETSPLTRNKLCKDQLVPNRAIKQAIAAWEKR